MILRLSSEETIIHTSDIKEIEGGKEETVNKPRISKTRQNRLPLSPREAKSHLRVPPTRYKIINK